MGCPLPLSQLIRHAATHYDLCQYAVGNGLIGRDSGDNLQT
jgi:hypothetical protein